MLALYAQPSPVKGTSAPAWLAVTTSSHRQDTQAGNDLQRVCVRRLQGVDAEVRMMISHSQDRAHLSNILHEPLRSVTLIDDALGQGQIYLAVSQTGPPTAGGMDVHNVITYAS